jgi:hypothetical protein
MNVSLISLIWLTAAVLQMALACVCYRNRIHKRRPAFAAFIYFQNVSCIFGACAYRMPSGSNMPPMIYFWTYYISIGLTAAIMLLVAIETGKHTFGPRMALPAWFPGKLATMVATAILLVTSVDLLFAVTNGGHLTRAMVRGERGLTIAALAIFLIIITYSRRLGISGQPQTQKIMVGFVLYLSVNVVGVFVRGSAKPSAGVIAIILGMGAYCASLVYWTVGLWAKEIVPERLTVQQTQDLTMAFGRLREKAIRLGVTATR